MNLAEALDAVPELPVHAVARTRHRLDPKLVTREQLNEDGAAIVVVFSPVENVVFRLPRDQYNVLLLFDGERSHADIAELYTKTYGIQIDEEYVRELDAVVEQSGLWYKSAQEKTLALSQKLAAERRKRSRRAKKKSDVAHISFKAWDPDKFLTWLDGKLAFVYSGWFTVITLALFAVTAWIWADRFNDITRDSLQYYRFSDKSVGDLASFWLLFLIIGFFHESAHGLTAKHYGAEVPTMGFMLVYLTPCFFVDITAVWVRTEKWRRIAAMFAGIWVELIICAVATIIWWGTPPGTPTHDFCYVIMMITGVMVIVINVNPLIKLDGYYILSEVIEIPELKENSTAYVSGWVKKNLFRLPVEVDYVPPRRRLLYVPYALLSGAYSYVLLFAVSRFLYNVLYRFTPEWAFIPALAAALLIFKSRISRLYTFMKSVYLNHRESLHQSITLKRAIPIAAALLALLVVPVWKKTASSLFVLEPARKSEIRASVPGLVTEVNVRENAIVKAGEPLLKIRNISLEHDAGQAAADLNTAVGRRSNAQISYVALGASISELRRAENVYKRATERLAELRPLAPVSGVVLTPRVEDLEGRYIAEGTPLVEIGDLSTLRARLYLPEFETRDVQVGQLVSLHMKGTVKNVHGTVADLAIAPSEIAEGLIEKTKYQGLKPPNFYMVTVWLPNDGSLKVGMSGEAKIMIRRQSLVAIAMREARDFVGRRFW